MTKRRQIFRAGFLALLVSIAGHAILAASASAQTYPNRPVTLVVPFAAGGISDIPGRALAAELQARIGQPVVVENRPGASGVTGASYVLRAEPDGYTLLVNALADVQNRHYLAVPYDAIADFALIGMVVDGPPLVLIVNAKEPYKSLAELIAYAKANPTKVSFGTSGPATSPAIAVTQLNALAKTSIVEVPYRGSAPAAGAVVTGEVQGAFAFYSSAKSLADDGRVRALAVANPRRLENWPEIPTMDELGFPGFHHAGFVGLAAPAKTPAPIVAFLNKHLNDAIKSESFKKRMEPLGMTAPADNSPASFAAFMQRETARQAELAKLSGHAPVDIKR
jgi:tripartite-type tricarboxylate transporter receptor subunit TctC